MPNEKIDQLIDVLEKQEIEVNNFKVNQNKNFNWNIFYISPLWLCPLHYMLNCLLLICIETSCEWL